MYLTKHLIFPQTLSVNWVVEAEAILMIYAMAPFRGKINRDHFGADINILFIITYLSYYFRGGAKKQPVPWHCGPGYNGAYVNFFFLIRILYTLLPVVS